MANPDVKKSYTQAEIESMLIDGIGFISGSGLSDGTFSVDSDEPGSPDSTSSGFLSEAERAAYLETHAQQFASVMDFLITSPEIVGVAGHIEEGDPVIDNTIPYRD